MSKLIRDCIGFALLRSVIGLEKSLHLLNQSDAKLNPIATCSLSFSRACGALHVFTLSPDWFLVTFTFVLIELVIVFTLVLVLRHSMDIDLDARISIRLVTYAVHVASLIPLEIFSLVSDPFVFFISLKDVALSNGLFLHYVMDKKSALEKSLALNIPNPSRRLLSWNYYNCCDF